MMEKTRYIIIGSQRSGTTVVHLVAMGHPNVSALNDEMKIVPFFSNGISTFTFGNDTFEEKNKGYSALFNALTLINGKKETRAQGIKIACGSDKLARIFINILKKNLKDVKIIYVIRKDIVAQYGSILNSARTGIFHSWYKGFEDRKIKKIKINKWRFIAYTIGVFKTNAVLEQLKNTHEVLEINYENIVKNPKEEYDRVFNFLNIPIMKPVWLKSKKVMPAPEEYIINYFSMKSLLNKLENNKIASWVTFFSKFIDILYKGCRYIKKFPVILLNKRI